MFYSDSGDVHLIVFAPLNKNGPLVVHLSRGRPLKFSNSRCHLFREALSLEGLSPTSVEIEVLRVLEEYGSGWLFEQPGYQGDSFHLLR